MLRASVIVFPGSNCDRDMKVAIERITGAPVNMVWHGNAAVPASDFIVLPGGFSYGDYLRCGAMAAHSPIMRDVIAKAKAGTPLLGVCNGFQILCEAGLLPGALTRNVGLRFVHRRQHLRVEADCVWTRGIPPGTVLELPVKHGEGRYVHDDPEALAAAGQVLVRYCTPDGEVTEEANPNGSLAGIAGVTNAAGNVAGLMPHPEHAVDPLLGSTDGRRLLGAVLAGVVAAS